MEEQEIRFTEEGGRRIAWARNGTGPPLLLCGWWMSHLELNWREPRFRAFAEALGRHRTVIRYDSPGTGLSAGDAPPATVDGEVAALAAVVKAAGATSVDLFAGSSGAPVGIAFAAAHPEQVERLLIYGGYASGVAIADARTRAALVDLVREHWGLGSRVLADVFMPSADGADREAFVAFQREATSAEDAARSLAAVYRFDVASRLGEVTASPTVLHRREDRSIPFELGRELAAELPGASLVALDGADHFPWFGDPVSVLRATLNALGVEGATPEPGLEARTEPASIATPAAAQDLSARETEVLALVATGLSDNEIADRSSSAPTPSTATSPTSAPNSPSQPAPPPSPRRPGAGCSELVLEDESPAFAVAFVQ